MKQVSTKRYVVAAVLLLLAVGGAFAVGLIAGNSRADDESIAKTADAPPSEQTPYKVVVPDAPEGADEQMPKTVLIDEPQTKAQGAAQQKPPVQQAKAAAGTPSQAEQDALWAQYKKLEGEQPEMLIDCTYCGGDGYYDEDCDDCGGSGRQRIPGTSYWSPCITCGNTGNKPCKNCFFGQMDNPNYEQQYDDWDAERRDILHQLGYTDDEIKQMDMAEARAYVEAHQSVSGGSASGGSSSGGSYQPPKGSQSCDICYGSGDCPTCNGAHGYWNPLVLSSWVVCPNCDHGECWKCGGSGQK